MMKEYASENNDDSENNEDDSKTNEDDSEIDCYKSFELLLLTFFYTVLTGLYLTASSLLQFGFVAVISATMLATHCTRFFGCKGQVNRNNN